MARRFRKARTGRRHLRRRLRRRTVSRKALRIARSVSRKMAGEVKKLDVNAIIPESKFIQVSNALGTAADDPQSLPDFAYCYNVFVDRSSATNPGNQGLTLGDFVGEQVRAKYLYLGIHVQMPVRPSTTSSEPALIQQPLCLRCMIIQDRNYNAEYETATLVRDIFGMDVGSGNTGTTTYQASADYTLLPINPQMPGRFNVIRDFKMYVAPGYRMDYYKKIMLLQRDLFSGGRFYAGVNLPTPNSAPGEQTSGWTNMRNRVYVLFLYQSPTLYGVNTSGSPDFTVSLQTRLAYYDN